MIKDKDIKALKKDIPKGLTYEMIANDSDSEVSVSDVKKFFSLRSVPLDKGLNIVKVTRKLILEVEAKIMAAFAA